MKKERLLWGLFFIFAAIFLLVAQTDFFKSLNIGFWTTIITVLLISIIIKCILNKNYIGTFFPLAFIGIIYDTPLGITNFTPWPLLGTATLLTIGCHMIFPKKKYANDWNNTAGYKSSKNVSFNENIDNNYDEHISQEVNFGSCVKYINSTSFKTGRFQCNFGSLKIYFNNSIMNVPQSSLNIDNNFAGMEIYVPKEWTVSDHITNTLGGVTEKGIHQPDGNFTLYLYGENNFGGIDIIYI